MNSLGVLFLSLTGCAPTPEASGVAMRSWSLPDGAVDEVQPVVAELLGGDDETPATGRAVVGPGGTLVVVAPPQVLAGVQQLITSLPAEPRAAQDLIEMTFWLVRGAPGDASRGPGLEPLTDVLDRIEALDGPQQLSLVSHQRAQSTSSQPVSLSSGTGPKLHYLARVDGSRIAAQIDWAYVPGRVRGVDALGNLVVDPDAFRNLLETQLVLTDGQHAVISQLGGPVDADGPTRHYLVVRGQRVP